MKDGEEIVFRNSWEETADKTPGDLIFVLKTHKHELFVRDGNDLRMKLNINLLESLVGFSHEFTHLDGRKVTIARDGVTHPGICTLLQLHLFKFFSLEIQNVDL